MAMKPPMNIEPGPPPDRVPVRVVASSKNWVVGDAVQQLQRVAQLPGVVMAVGMPDLHPGKGVPIGAAVATSGVLYPHLAGNDIGCGMALWQTDLLGRKLKLDRWVRKLNGLESPWEGDVAPLLAEAGIAATPFDGSLGTIGGGNHFAELQAIVEVQNPAALATLGVTAGQGPAECHWVVAQVVEVLHREAAQQGIDCKLLEGVPGDEDGTWKSAPLALEGEGVQALAASWEGTIQWIGKSPYRPSHKRKNWFVGVEVYSPPQRPQWSESDLRIDVMRSSGPGGQHVNKTSSAVRITQVSTGLSVVAREERSQHQNRRLALARLAQLMETQHANAEGQAKQRRWEQHGDLERGNPVRVYEGPDFRARRRAGRG